MILRQVQSCVKRHANGNRKKLLRPAFSTVELLVSTSISSVLALGLSSAIFIASKSLDLPKQNVEVKALLGNEFGRLHDTLSDATSIVEFNDQEIHLFAPDRDGDGIEEQIEYVVEDRVLTEQINDGDTRVVSGDIEAWELTSSILTGPAPPNKQVSFDSAFQASLKNQIEATVELPSGSVVGDFIVLVFAADRIVDTPLAHAANWSLIASHAEREMTLAAWHKRVEVEGETVSLTWETPCNVATSTLRFSNVSPNDSISSSNSLAAQGNAGGKTPWAPAVEIQNQGGLVLQILSVRKNVLANQSNGLTGHMVCQYIESENLALVCSTHQAGEQTGIFDANNSYTFTRNGEYVAMGIGLAAAE